MRKFVLKKNTQTFIFLLTIVSIFSFLICSCSSPKNITYFQDVPDTIRKLVVDESIYNAPKIQSDDILDVTIQTLDGVAIESFNQQNTSLPSSNISNLPDNLFSSQGKINGYLVDKQGYVVLPLLGRVFVEGKSTAEIRDSIRNKALEYFKEPVVNVRFANFRVTVLGEVNKPSTYVMPNEKVTLLDAIGAAGDLTIYGKRENITLIRNNKGKREIVKLNLNSSKIFSSPYFYLQQADVIYVEPNKSKINSTDMAQVRRISILASALSVLIVIASRINY